MAINNPYVPGDPYSYDLKWLVRKIKETDVLLSTLDQKIIDMIVQLLDQHDPLYWKTADALIHSDMKTPSLAYIEGFYEEGDGGANLYYITSDYNDVLAADFYITLDGANRWGIPIICTPYVTPEMFGAVGDGSEDDTIAVQTAATIAANLGCELRAMGGKSYLITDTVTIDGTNVDKILIDGVIKLGMNDRVGVHLTNCTKNEIRIAVSGLEYNGGYSTAPTDFDFQVLPFVGVLFDNTVKSQIYLSAENCNVGARFLGDGAACCFNTVTLGMMVNCAINLELASNNGGWVNDNLFLNGNFSCWNDNTFRTNHVDIFQRSIDGVNGADNNIFLKASFEGGGLPIYIKKGSFNQFRYMRCENGTTYYSKVEDGRDNVFDGGYGIALPLQKNEADSPWQIVKNIKTQQLEDLVLLHKWEFNKWDNAYIKASGSSYWANTIPGVDNFGQGYATPENVYYVFPGTAIPEEDGLTNGATLVYGYYVDVTNIKTLYARFLNADGSNAGRFAFRFFDSSWNTIQPAVGTGVKTDSNFSIFYQTQHLVSGTPYAGISLPLYLNDASIKYVFVGVQNFTKLCSIETYTTIKSVSTNEGGLVFTRQPKTGDVEIVSGGLKCPCKKGRIILNAPQAANGDGSYNFGYVCTDPSTQTWATLKSAV